MTAPCERPQSLLDRVNADLPVGIKLGLMELHDEFRLDAATTSGALAGPSWPKTDTVRDEHLTVMLRAMQGELIEHVLGHAWPLCPIHASHPLAPTAEGWRCPDADDSWNYGTLRDVAPDKPVAVPDNHVRWVLPDLGWGVIADSGDDIFFATVAIQPRTTSVREGDSVEVELDNGRQGLFRRARAVRVLGGNASPTLRGCPGEQGKY